MRKFLLKHHKKVVVFASVILFAVVYTLNYMDIWDIGYGLMIGMCAGFGIAVKMTMSYSAVMKLNKHLNRYEKECDPFKMANILEADLDTYKSLGINKSYLYLNMANVYMDLGRFDKALESLENLDTKSGQMQYLKKYYMFDCFAECGRAQDAVKVYEEMEQELKNIKGQATVIKMMQLQALARIKYFAINRDFEASMKQIDEVWRINQNVISSSKRKLVSFMCLRAKICMERGEYQSARELFEKVIQIGNKLYATEEAKRYMGSIANLA